MLRLKSSVSQSKNSLNIDAVNVVHTWIVMKNFLVEKSMNYGSIYEREIGFEKGLFESIFLRSQGGLYEQKFVIIHERSVS